MVRAVTIITLLVFLIGCSGEAQQEESEIMMVEAKQGVSGPLASQTFLLNDGRTLGYSEWGAADGTPVFYFHGGQESRLSSGFLDEAARDLGIRIIAPERPGVGISSPQPGRRFVDWATDIRELANGLRIERFGVVGLSGGAPHALAVAAEMPGRVTRVSLVSGAAPADAPNSFKGMWFPVKIIHWLARRHSGHGLTRFLESDRDALVADPAKRVRQFQTRLPEPDRILLSANPHYAWEFIAGSAESYKQGTEGVAQEYRLYVSDWGIDMGSIATTADLWYGSDDKMAPVARGRYYETALPNASLRVLDNEAHFSLIRNHTSNILAEFVNADSSIQDE